MILHSLQSDTPQCPLADTPEVFPKMHAVIDTSLVETHLVYQPRMYPPEVHHHWLIRLGGYLRCITKDVSSDVYHP